MTDDLIQSLQQLLILDRGDRGRLEYILDLVKRGKILPESDLRYLKILMSLYIDPKDSEPDKRNTEATIEQLHKEIVELNNRIQNFESKGFQKYIGHKTILLFVTFFVAFNTMEPYLQTIFPTIQYEGLKYLFPLSVIANYFNLDYEVWIVLCILLLAWPFIGAIHLTKFIRSRKISEKFHNHTSSQF